MYFEDASAGVVPTLASSAAHSQLSKLRQIEAFTDAIGPLICPNCEAYAIRIVRISVAWCPSCRRVAWRAEDRVRWMPDGEWLRRRIAQALGVRSGAGLPVVNEHVWRIGDVGHGPHRRRVLFGRQIGSIEIHRQLHKAWTSQVGDTPAVLITTTPVEQLLLMLILPVQIVSLSAAFRLHGAGLVADGPVWRGVTLPMPQQPLVGRFGPFAADFSDVTLPGESQPIALTPMQSAVLRALWEADGRHVKVESLLRRVNADLAKPVDAFPRNKYPEANRAYRVLVRTNRRGEYWLETLG